MKNFRFRYNKNILNPNGKFSKNKSCVGWKRAVLCIIIVIFSVYMIWWMPLANAVLYQSNRWPDVVIQRMLIHNKNDGKTSIKTMNTCSMFGSCSIHLRPLWHTFFFAFFPFGFLQGFMFPMRYAKRILKYIDYSSLFSIKVLPIKIHTILTSVI